MRLKSGKACPTGDIPNLLLRKCSLSLATPLTNLFNCIINEGVFSQIWKQAEVIPVFKKSDKFLPPNYRPISLLSTLSIVFERVLHTKLMDCLNENNLLSPLNIGFKKNYSSNYLTNKCHQQTATSS